MPRVSLPVRLAVLLTVSLGFVGTVFADAPAKPKKDPLERMNRATYRFNDALDRHFLRPLAEAYRNRVPEPIRNGLANFVANIEYTEVILNDTLQLKLKAAGQDIARVVVNTTLGVGGLGDPASRFGLPVHNEDFGQTLGYWGVPPGPYLVLPLLGSSDFRDAPSWIADAHAVGERYLDPPGVRWGISGLSVFQIRVQALAANEAIDKAFDPYALVRDAYLARRNYLVHDGNVPNDDGGYDTDYSPAEEATVE